MILRDELIKAIDKVLDAQSDDAADALAYNLLEEIVLNHRYSVVVNKSKEGYFVKAVARYSELEIEVKCETKLEAMKQVAQKVAKLEGGVLTTDA